VIKKFLYAAFCTVLIAEQLFLLIDARVHGETHLLEYFAHEHSLVCSTSHGSNVDLWKYVFR
jgi:hypothetical protein